MKAAGTIILLLFIFSYSSFAQQKKTFIRASSNIVDVRINGFLKKAEWVINPENPLDIYSVRRAKYSSKITFITDLDSLSFDVKRDNNYDFVIVLNGKDSCHTRIKALNTYRTSCQNCVIVKDTIPFTLGSDNRIYIEGKINNSETIKILYDNGAEGTGLAESALSSKVKLSIDGTGESKGTGGIVQTQTSSSNKLQIGKLIWDEEFISIGKKKFGKGADAIVGYSIFSDKIVEIDYEKNLMIIHDTLPKIIGYTKANVQFHDFLPSIQASLIVGNKIYKEFFLIDIGASGTAFVNTGFAEKNNLYYTMKKIDEGITTGIGKDRTKNETVLLPKLLIEENELNQVPVILELPSNKKTGIGNLLGMDVLKRFNTIIDYQNSAIFLKPNNLINTRFKGKNKTATYLIITLTVLSLLAGGFIILKKRNHRQQQTG